MLFLLSKYIKVMLIQTKNYLTRKCRRKIAEHFLITFHYKKLFKNAANSLFTFLPSWFFFSNLFLFATVKASSPYLGRHYEPQHFPKSMPFCHMRPLKGPRLSTDLLVHFPLRQLDPELNLATMGTKRPRTFPQGLSAPKCGGDLKGASQTGTQKWGRGQTKELSAPDLVFRGHLQDGGHATTSHFPPCSPPRTLAPRWNPLICPQFSMCPSTRPPFVL